MMEGEQKRRILKTARESVISMMMLFAVFSFLMVFRTIQVDGTSMEPTLKHRQIGLMINNPATIVADDILVFSYEPYVNEKNYAVKRVVGVGGDTIMYSAGMLSINGIERPEYSNPGDDSHLYTDIIQLGHDEYWVLGDNMDPGESLDSRTFGKVEGKWVVGKLLRKNEGVKR